MMKSTLSLAASTFPVLLALAGCASVPTTRFVNPGFDFGYVERVAVLPFEALGSDRQSASRTTRLFITELLATGAVDVVEPGEVRAALNRLKGIGLPLSSEQVIEIGGMLGVQAVIQGSVNESQMVRAGTATVPVVTLDVHMLEVETGATIWAATHTEKGAGFGSKVLGTGGSPISATTRECVKKIIKSLVD
jgi:TolB-like protein